MPALPTPQLEHLRSLVSRDRLVRDTMDLCSLYSRTGEAKPALDRLAEILAREGFTVERPEGGYAAAPAVAVRYSSGKPGPTIQFNGHLDTVHLPFVPPQHEGDRITGTGSCDMKGGTVAALEALRVVRDSGALTKGSILLTAHDLHEAPWGDGTQLEGLIRQGYCGDAVLIPEYLNSCIPTAGRGLAIWKLTIRRPGAPVHEVLRPANEPSVIEAGAEMIARLRQYGTHLASKTDPVAGPETVFVGQVHSGVIFNQFPQELVLEGTRRWLPGESRYLVEEEFRKLVQQVADHRHSLATGAGWLPARHQPSLREDLRRQLHRHHGADPAAGTETVLRRLQRVLVAGRYSRNHPRPEFRRGPHAGRVGVDRRHGPGRPTLRRHRPAVLQQLSRRHG
jgi:acetylornithine deacetylase/succinyl-diaminopimelate desuccinylase-like protein